MLTLKANSLNWALEHALRYGDTDVFPLPFEYDAIQHDWTELRTWLEGHNILEWHFEQTATDPGNGKSITTSLVSVTMA